MFDIGLWIEDQYLVLERYRGRRWILYIVQDRISENLFAVKAPAHILSPAASARFVRKAHSWINLGESDEIANAYLLKELHGVPHLLVEYIDGPSLADILDSHPGLPLPIPQAVAFMKQLISGMKFLRKASLPDEGRGMVHGNLIPRNILTKSGNVKITDIGLADALREDLKSFRAPLGEIPYLAPEYLDGGAKANELSDIYSFGAIMYEVATGTLPRTSAASADPLSDILRSGPVAPRRRNRSCPRWLEETILKCMAVEPENRFQSFEHIDAFINEVLRFEEIPGQEEGGEPARASRVARVRGGAKKESRELDHYYLGVEHLMLGLIAEEESVVMSCLGDRVSADQLRSEIIGRLPKGEGPWYWEGMRKTPRYKKVMRLARKIRREFSESRMLPHHILLAILEEGRNVPARALKDLNVDVKAAAADLRRELRRTRPIFVADQPDTPHALFTCRVRCADEVPGSIPFVGRNGELRRAESLLLDDGRSIIIIGDPGVGKSAFVSKLECEVSDSAHERGQEFGGFFKLRTAALLGGAKGGDDILTRFVDTLDAIAASSSMLVMEDLSVLLGPVKKAPAAELADILVEHIVSKGLKMVATATSAGYVQCESEHANLVSFLEAINLFEPPEEETRQILEAARGVFEEEHSVKVSDDAVNSAMELSREVRGRALPASALELLDQACTATRSSSARLPAGSLAVDTRRVEEAAAKFLSTLEARKPKTGKAN